MKKVKCFEEEFDASKSYTVLNGGLKPIETSRITGTVDKCDDLDYKFRYRRRGNLKEHFRRQELEKAAKRYTIFSPIQVIRYKNEYYVIDGNRRVALAKEQEVDYIDAYITDYVEDDDQDEIDGVLLRRRFDVETSLSYVTLSNNRGYEFLLEEIQQYPKEEDIKEKAKKWKSERFLPFCRAIDNSALPNEYPELRTEDIYVLISRFYKEFMNGVPNDIGFETLISGYLFARKKKKQHRVRRLLMRTLSRLLGWNRQ